MEVDPALIEEFRSYLEDGLEKPLQPSTIATYVKTVQTALQRRNPYLTVSDKKLAPKTRFRFLAAMRHWARFIGDLDALETMNDRKAFRELKKHSMRVTRKHRSVTHAQVSKILDVTDVWRDEEYEPRWAWACLNLIIKLGLRAKVDMAWIQRQAVEDAVQHEDYLTIRTKGGKERDVSAAPVIEELRHLLTMGKWDLLYKLIAPQAKAPDDALYIALYRQLKSAVEQAGLDPTTIHPHMLRHYAAELTLEATKDIVSVQKLMGHKNIQTTMIYLDKDRTKSTGKALKEVYERRRKG